jgi:diaminopropionate ammonia-lyase
MVVEVSESKAECPMDEEFELIVNESFGGLGGIEPCDGTPFLYHRGLPGYRPGPLRRLRVAERTLGVRRVWVKDESDRFGLPAFKVLGASWAVYRRLCEALGLEPGVLHPLKELKNRAMDLGPLELVTATDGNHGRGVARTASWLGLGALIFMPAGSAAARIDAIRSEGARVTVVEGDYDDAVEAAAAMEGHGSWLIQDTAWPGYETVPGWIVEGYSTIGLEADEALAALKEPPPDLVAVQIGVGSLAAAMVRHYRSVGCEKEPRMLGVEPVGAACALESIRAGRLRSVPGPHRSVMAGLNCGSLSSIAWPLIRDGIDAFVAIGDGAAFDSMRMLAAEGIVSGESGASGLAGLLEIAIRDRETLHGILGLSGVSNVLVISTEGITDPLTYDRIVG